MLETKEIMFNGKEDEAISDSYLFGWEKTQKMTKIESRTHRDYVIMARDTEMEHYNEYKKLEMEYKMAKAKLKVYKPMTITNILFYFVLFLLPGIIYVTIKNFQKTTIERENAKIYEQIDQIINTLKTLK